MPTPTIAMAHTNSILSMRRVNASQTRLKSAILLDSLSTCRAWRCRAAVARRAHAYQRNTASVALVVAGGHRNHRGRTGRAVAQQEIIDHLARDRRGGLRAEAAILHEHGERDPRLVGRGVRHEQGMIAQALVD